MSAKITINQIPINYVARGFKDTDWPRLLELYPAYCTQARAAALEPDAWIRSVCDELARRPESAGRTRRKGAVWYAKLVETFGEEWLQATVHAMAETRRAALAPAPASDAARKGGEQ